MILNKISLFHSLGFPILIGTSRKRFINQISGKFDTKKELEELIIILFSLSQGIQIFRVHNVREIKQGILVFQNLLNK
jgi:dihydropteroate synthase